jgi:hypothetical protein
VGTQVTDQRAPDDFVGRPDEVMGDYLEFMGEAGRRSLCVKTYAPPGLLRSGESASSLSFTT